MADRMPLVSVVIPAYNCESYISECVRNILQQTYDNLQIVLVDDGSRDGTYRLCQSFTDDRICLIHKENGGASSARNEGLRHVTGEYILFVDSDDTPDTDAVRVLVETAEANHADLVYYEAENYAEDSSLPVKKNGLSQSADYPILPGHDLIPRLVQNKDYHAAPYLYFVRADVLKKSDALGDGIRFCEGIMFEDELFSYRVLSACETVVCLRQQLYRRRVHAGSVMTSAGKQKFRLYSILTVFNHLHTLYRANPTDATAARYMARIGMLVVGYREQLPQADRAYLKDEYTAAKQVIRREKGFGSRELVARTYGKGLWMLCAAPNRLVKKLRK